MKYSRLGRTDITVSRITHGCMELGGGRWEVRDRKDNIALLQEALDAGMNSFDTAEVYGLGCSEQIVGEAMEGRRHRAFLASKVSPEHLDRKSLREAAENSLRNLRTDYMDLYYLHWPNPDIPMEETLGEMERLKTEGKIRTVGVSNFNLEQLREAVKITEISALQIEYNLLSREAEKGLLDYCIQNQISVFSYNSIAKGILSGIFHQNGRIQNPTDFRKEKEIFQPENMKRQQALVKTLREIAGERKVSAAQVAIAWVLGAEGLTSAIVGTQNPLHFRDNICAADLELSMEERRRLTEQSTAVIGQLINRN